MRHSIFLVALTLLSATSISAQEKTPSLWTKAGFVGLKFTQSSFTNWAAGGENALALDAQFTYQADYKNEKHLWQNRVELNYGFNQTGDAPLKKTTDKIYLNNTNLMYALVTNPDIGTIRETFFFNQLSQSHSLLYPAEGDFKVDGKYTFEVGGKGKSFTQIKDLPASYLAVDGIEIGHHNRIPLWMFGLLY